MYTLLDYGSWVEDTSDDLGDPFIQLLSITDVQKAHQDFVNVRLDGVDTTGSPSQALLPVDQMQHSPETEAEKKAQYVAFFSPVIYSTDPTLGTRSSC